MEAKGQGVATVTKAPFNIPRSVPLTSRQCAILLAGLHVYRSTAPTPDSLAVGIATQEGQWPDMTPGDFVKIEDALKGIIAL